MAGVRAQTPRQRRRQRASIELRKAAVVLGRAMAEHMDISVVVQVMDLSGKMPCVAESDAFLMALSRFVEVYHNGR